MVPMWMILSGLSRLHIAGSGLHQPHRHIPWAFDKNLALYSGGFDKKMRPALLSVWLWCKDIGQRSKAKGFCTFSMWFHIGFAFYWYCIPPFIKYAFVQCLKWWQVHSKKYVTLKLFRTWTDSSYSVVFIYRYIVSLLYSLFCWSICEPLKKLIKCGLSEMNKPL